MYLCLPVAAGIPVATVEDYDPYNQRGLFPNYNPSTQFLAKGHLAPNGDYKDNNGERSFTLITTNIAPQWQPFNEGNWKNIEAFVKKYASEKPERTLYIFTGTGRMQLNYCNIFWVEISDLVNEPHGWKS